ncbi:hypothetical protein CLG85_018710 [Yangia mangrovi]|uniref:Uncharacterized protein n=1 Tax=Alloyangia mangrovi TaxID=1779329 RepID=A0A2A3JZ32_9RHOB|nr:hypothetical protein [Alloyangia mangrovi]MCT4372238.1 hypothetical protein [Alloyangia mangrovi]
MKDPTPTVTTSPLAAHPGDVVDLLGHALTLRATDNAEICVLMCHVFVFHWRKSPYVISGTGCRFTQTAEAGGDLKHGTEIVAYKDRFLAALLGTLAAPPGRANHTGPGAEIRPEQLLGAWAEMLRVIGPSCGTKLSDDLHAL